MKKQRLVALAVSLIVAAVGGWFYLLAGEEVTISESIATTQTVAVPSPLSESEKANYSDEYEEVLGLMVRKDRDCTLSAIPIYEESGDMSCAYMCEPNNSPEVHAFAAEDIDTLRDWAYNDSEASEILAIKLIEAGDEEEGLRYVYRAVALESGKTFKAIDRAHATFYADIADRENPEGVMKPNLDSMTQAYVFDRVRSILLGADHTVLMRRELEQWDFTDFAPLDAEAANVVAEMARIEREVVGSNMLGGKVDA